MSFGLYANISRLANKFCMMCFAGRKEDAIQKYPQLIDQINFFMNNDPSGNLKYLDWQLKVLKSGKALQDEIVDVTNLFDKFKHKLKKKDIYQYPVQEFTNLRDELFTIEQNKNSKKQQQGAVEEAIACGHADIYDSDNFKVKHIFNKAASVHYGQGTKWCITMQDRGYFEQYSMNNVIFFFIFNKKLNKDNPHYKIAAAYKRDQNNEIIDVDYFDAEDNQKMDVDFMTDDEDNLKEWARMRLLMERVAANYPKSAIAKVFDGSASEEELLLVLNDKETQQDPTHHKRLIETILNKYENGLPEKVIDYILQPSIMHNMHVNSLVINLLHSNLTAEQFDKVVNLYIEYGDRSNTIISIIEAMLISPHCSEKHITTLYYSGGSDRIRDEEWAVIFLQIHVKTPPSIILDIYSKLSDSAYVTKFVLKHPNTPDSVVNNILESDTYKIHIENKIINAYQKGYNFTPKEAIIYIDFLMLCEDAMKMMDYSSNVEFYIERCRDIYATFTDKMKVLLQENMEDNAKLGDFIVTYKIVPG